MSSADLIQKTIADHAATVVAFQEACSTAIEALGARCLEAIENGNKVCFFGNGGSAADAQHFAAEFVVRFTKNRRGLPSLAFTTDTSVLTACANDFGYDRVFARQVEALCVPGDVVIGISTSGSSANVVAGLEQAREMGVATAAFTGANAGKCGELADLVLAVPSEVTARIQECHLIAGHLICDIVERAISES